MFDVGFAELILLFIIGLLVLGPERLPKVARTVGGLTRKARSSWLNLKRSIEAEMRAEELKQPFEKFQKDVRSTVDDLNRKVDTMKQTSLTGKPAADSTPASPASTELPSTDTAPKNDPQ